MLPHLSGMTLVIALVAVCFSASRNPWQEPDDQGPAAANARIADLEARVGRLENLLFSTTQLSVYDAERRLGAAHRQMEQNRRLYYRGFLSAIEIERSRYEVERARRELELARADSRHRHIAAEIDVLQAEFGLKEAEDRLHFDRNFATRGYVSEHQLRDDEQAVERAAKALDVARQKLKALALESTD